MYFECFCFHIPPNQKIPPHIPPNQKIPLNTRNDLNTSGSKPLRNMLQETPMFPALPEVWPGTLMSH